MSQSHFEQGKKPLDMFFWVNEITGEITYPPLMADAPAACPAPLEKTREGPGSQPGSLQRVSPGPVGVASTSVQKAASPSPPKVSLRDTGFRYSLPSTPTHLAKARVRSPLPFSAIPVTISLPGRAPSPFGPLSPDLLPAASTFPPSFSAPWAFTCKLKNVLTGNNRFSF
uniref:chromosome 13 C3orf86 homolog n=1 Tax=Sus scrofa TaxID=9823 RepID=UPI0003AF18D3